MHFLQQFHISEVVLQLGTFCLLWLEPLSLGMDLRWKDVTPLYDSHGQKSKNNVLPAKDKTMHVINFIPM